MEEKDLKIDSFVVTCMNNIYGDDAEVNNEWYLECLNKAKDTKEFEKLYFLLSSIRRIVEKTKSVL